MNYLITGGAGFIGHALVEKLSRKKNNKILVIDFQKKIKNIIKVKNVRYIAGNIENIKTFKKIKLKIDIAYHFAAQTSAQIGEEKPVKNFQSNVVGTNNFISWAILNKPKICYFSSSMAVYGNKCKNQKENYNCEPVSNYGLSKFIGEILFKKLKKKKINYCILRLFNVYGPGQDLKNLKQGMISIYIAQAIKGNVIKVSGSLSRSRDFIYLDDLISLLTSKKLEKNQTYNVGLGKSVSVRKIINLIKLNLKKKIKVIKIQNSPGDIFHSYANISKLKKIKFYPKISIEEGIKKFLKTVS